MLGIDILFMAFVTIPISFFNLLSFFFFFPFLAGFSFYKLICDFKYSAQV